ncbi:hypothetical protein [Planobispora takensis]|uniref:Aspartate carbamoyltransferase n=1 Tax=Planobispora takensis TaxID=1367882 RepID=A0A8J3T4P3_9ACTN|nr:hypothetical protein [Planobispora takensis]GII04381.1 hypothetical protein Pta02_63890 [Planobispora takensis]
MSGRNRVAVIAAAALVVAAGLTALGVTAGDARQREVADRGRTVMPFDLDRTTHRFTKAGDGGVQTVVADDPSDAGQIRLIREHLTEETARFGRGDFGDPASIHGSSMPGLRELSAGYRDIEVAYAELPGGAELTYTTSDPALVTALHSWFDAQVDDHGEHAEHG